ncbi:uncharacterized protein TNCV_3634221 [Trichonephila clavipes]|nr:uncharacterized protein TNCV_3634221 [Trichonephila clavipes]
MSRRKHRSAFDQVSEFDRGRIVANRDCGLSFREIGSRVGRNQTTVMRICDRWMQEGTTDRRGQSHPPQCTTSRVAAVAEWYRYRTVACFVTGSNPVPLKTRRVGQRCTLNLSRAETSSRWCGVVVRRGGCQLRCRPRHLTMVQNYVVRRQKPSCS